MSIKKLLNSFMGSVLAVFAVPLLAFTPIASAAVSTVTVTGNTSAGENQPGWLFNRDASTDTPYVFTTDQQSIGAGSLYVQPIGANAADKFVAENFINSPITNVNSISYDFRIGSGGVDTEEEQFYMNVYANFGVSDDLKFYDCRYNVVPTIGSTGGFTTVTFDPTQAYPVTTRIGVSASPFACPAIPADMDNDSAGSNIRMFSLNVGDTSASDEGLDGYLDNVVVTTNTDMITYDFEVLAPPIIISPANGAVVTSTVLDKVDWNDIPGAVNYEYQVFSDAAYTSSLYGPATVSASEIPTPGTPEGNYYLRVRAVAVGGNVSAWSNDAATPYLITVDNTSPTADLEFLSPGPTSTSFRVVFSESVIEAEAENPANYFLTNWPSAGGSGDLFGDAIVVYDDTSKTATVTFTNPGSFYVSAEQQWGVVNVHDLAGNLLNPNPTTEYSSPLAGPLVPGIPATAPNPTTSTTQVWNWTAATDPGGPEASGVASYEYTTDGGATWTNIGNVLSVTTNLPIGTHSLSVRAIDNAGNLGAESTGTVTVLAVFATLPATKDQCKNGGWATFTGATFKNQGDCVSFVASKGRNTPSSAVIVPSI